VSTSGQIHIGERNSGKFGLNWTSENAAKRILTCWVNNNNINNDKMLQYWQRKTTSLTDAYRITLAHDGCSPYRANVGSGDTWFFGHIRVDSTKTSHSCYSASDRGAEYRHERVCVFVYLCVCVSAFIFLELHVRSSLICAHVTYGHGSVLIWRRSDISYTSGFMDDVISQSCSTSPPS